MAGHDLQRGVGNWLCRRCVLVGTRTWINAQPCAARAASTPVTTAHQRFDASVQGALVGSGIAASRALEVALLLSLYDQWLLTGGELYTPQAHQPATKAEHRSGPPVRAVGDVTVKEATALATAGIVVIFEGETCNRFVVLASVE